MDEGLRVKIEIATAEGRLDEEMGRQSGNSRVKESEEGSELAAHTITKRTVNGTACVGFIRSVCLWMNLIESSRSVICWNC